MPFVKSGHSFVYWVFVGTNLFALIVSYFCWNVLLSIISAWEYWTRICWEPSSFFPGCVWHSFKLFYSVFNGAAWTICGLKPLLKRVWGEWGFWESVFVCFLH